MKTWQLEALVVGVALGSVAFFTGNRLVEWLTALAVFLTFCHIQVATRLAEAEDRRTMEPRVQADRVHCHRWLTRYLVGKEICWTIVFYMLGSYAALVGVGLFLSYPLWRSYWLRRRGH